MQGEIGVPATGFVDKPECAQGIKPVRHGFATLIGGRVLRLETLGYRARAEGLPGVLPRCAGLAKRLFQPIR